MRGQLSYGPLSIGYFTALWTFVLSRKEAGRVKILTDITDSAVAGVVIFSQGDSLLHFFCCIYWFEYHPLHPCPVHGLIGCFSPGLVLIHWEMRDGIERKYSRNKCVCILACVCVVLCCVVFALFCESLSNFREFFFFIIHWYAHWFSDQLSGYWYILGR